MTYIMCGLVSIISNLKAEDSKVWSYIFLFVLWFIGGLSTERLDYIVYSDFFNFHSLSLGSMTEPLYLLINTLAYETGMSYDVFFALQVAVSLLLLYNAFNFFKTRKSIVLTLYLLFPFAISVVQIRYFLATSIVIFAMKYLFLYFREKSLKCLLYYVFFVIVAGLIHYATVFFLVCLVPVVFRKLKDFWMYFLGILFGVIFANIGVFVAVFIPFIGARKAMNWLSIGESSSLAHIIFILVLRFGILLIMYLSLRTPIVDKVKIQENDLAIDTFIYKIMIFLIVSITPLELFIQQYARLTRVYLILFYILLGRRVPLIKYNNRLMFSLLLGLLMLVLCYYEYSRGAASGAALWNTVLRSVFESNLIFS